MKDNEELFEMSPPNMVSVAGQQFMASGKENRYKDVTPAIRQRILDYCRQTLNISEYPAQKFYPDLVIPPAGEIESVLQPSPNLSHN